MTKIPLVVRDKRPTREEAGSVWAQDGSFLLKRPDAILSLMTLECQTSSPPSFMATDDLEDFRMDGSAALGEVWRAVGPDGAPIMVEVER